MRGGVQRVRDELEDVLPAPHGEEPDQLGELLREVGGESELEHSARDPGPGAGDGEHAGRLLALDGHRPLPTSVLTSQPLPNRRTQLNLASRG